MAKNKVEEIKEKVRQTLKELEEMLDDLAGTPRPRLQPVPVPVDRPPRRRPRPNNSY